MVGASKRSALSLVLCLVGFTLGGCVESVAANGEATTSGSAGPVAATSFAGSYLAGRFASSVPDAAAASRFYDGALKFDPGNTQLRREAMLAYLMSGNYVQAATLAGTVARLERDDPIATLVALVGEIRLGQYDAAAKRLATMPSNAAIDLLKPVHQAWILQGQHKTGEALTVLDTMAGDQGVLPIKLYHRALIAALDGRKALAAQSFAALRQTAVGGWTRSIAAEGAFLESVGEQPAARVLYQARLRDLPDNATLQSALDRLDHGAGTGLLVTTPSEGVGEAMFGVATLLAQEDAIRPAIVYLRLALMARPALAEAQLLLADLFERTGDRDQALGLYDQIPRTAAIWWSSRIRYALALDHFDRPDDALAELARLEAERPDDASAYLAAGDIYRGREQFAKAIPAYSKAIALTRSPTGDDWSVYFLRAIAYERTKQWDAAEADLRQALELRPEEPDVLNYLAYSWTEQGRNLRQAEAMLVKAAAARPDDGYIVDSLGWVYFRQGRFDKAVVQLERAVALKPGDPVLNEHLGDAYWAIGRRIEAKFQWRIALALNPPSDVRDGITKKLAEGLPQAALVPGEP